MTDHPQLDRADRDLLFVSYSHRDGVWAQRFDVMLKPLVRRQRLQLWIDSTIRAGATWQPEIEQAIRRSRLALLLVSADYLASDFIMDDELPTLIRHGVTLAPVLVGDCMWQHVPELAAVQWLHDPDADGALGLHAGPYAEAERDRRIRLACERLVQVAPTEPEPVSDRLVEAVAVAAAPTTEATVRGALSQVPPLPPGYVVRDELDAILDQVIGVGSGGAVGLTAPAAGLGLQGIGGIGKTVLAIALVRDDRIRNRFPDGVYWVTVGEHPDLLTIQLDLLARLGDRTSQPRTVSEARERLRRVAAERRVLIVVDDVWSDGAALAFRITGPSGRLIYTSRDEQVITAAGATAHRIEVIEVLSREVARGLAAGILNIEVDALPATADHAFAQVRRVPLAVALLSAAVRNGKSWLQVASTLDQHADVYGDHPYATTFRAMHLATTALSPELREALLGLAVFPPDADIPVAAVARYWTHSHSSTEAETRTDLDRLAKAKVLQHAGDRIGFHDLQHDYLLLHAPNLAVLHAELLAAYRHLLPADTVDRWWQLPDDEPYLRDHLVEHLGSAGERRSLAITVTDPAYHVQRIAHDGVHASVADLDTASRFLGKSRATWWAGWLVRHAHLLDRRRSCTVTQLRRRNTAATVKAWLEAERHQSADMDTTGLDALLSQPHLALVGGLSAPSENLVRILTGHASSIAAVAWSPDGTHLATAGDDQTVRIWNRTTGEATATLTGHVGPGAYGGLVARRHPVGRRRRRQVGPDLGPHHRSDRHDPHRPHPLGERGRLVARRHPAGHRQRRQDRPDLGLDHRRDTDRSPGHTSWVNAVAWSPDGTYLATSDSNGVIILWTRRGDESTSITIQAASSLAWSRTGLAVVFDLACSR